MEQWWLDWDALNARRSRFPSRMAFASAQNDMLERYPPCDTELLEQPRAGTGDALRH